MRKKTLEYGGFVYCLLLPLCLIVLMSIRLYGQNTDSLDAIVKTHADDTVKVKALNELVRLNIANSPQKSRSYLNQSYPLAIKLDYKTGIARCLFFLGNLEVSVGNNTKGLAIIDSSLKICQAINYKVLCWDNYNLKANAFRTLSKYDSSLKYHHTALAIAKELDDKSAIAASYNNIGNVYLDCGVFLKAIENYLQAYKIDESINDQRTMLIDLVNLGLVYQEIHNYKKALEYDFKCLSHPEAAKYKIIQAAVNNNIGNVYRILGKHNEALNHLFASLRLYEDIEDKNGISAAIGSLAEAYEFNDDNKAQEYNFKSLKLAEELGDKKALAMAANRITQIYTRQKRYDEALDYGMKGLKEAEAIHANDILRDLYKTISELLQAQKKYEQSLGYYKLYTKIKDSIFNLENAKAVAELQTQFDTDRKEKEIKLLTMDKQLSDKTLKEQRIIRGVLIAGIAILFFITFILFNRYLFKRKANLQLERQKLEIEHKNMLITDSINYAKTIQEAILPAETSVKSAFPDSFILYKPKSIVSGDFYWVGEKDNKIICIVADCTGHGVPGAFMSLLGNNLLSNVIKKINADHPANLLNSLHQEVISVLNVTEESIPGAHGIDMAVIFIDRNSNKLQFAGAHNPLYLVRDGVLLETKADRMQVGIAGIKIPVHFTSHTLDYKRGDVIYMFSDGYPDQIGGSSRRKFYYQPFKDLLLSVYRMEMRVQKERLEKAITDWQGNYDQTDDMLVMGIRL